VLKNLDFLGVDYLIPIGGMTWQLLCQDIKRL